MAAARPNTWMPLYVGDYLADTMHLTTEQHGAYLLLLLGCWRFAGRLLADDEQLAAVAKLPIDRWRQIKPVIAPFFQADGEYWTHGRVTKELQRAQELTRKRTEAGRARAQQTPQQTGSKPLSKQAANAPAKDEQTGRPSPSHIREESLSNARDHAEPLPAEQPPPVVDLTPIPPLQRRPIPPDWQPNATDNLTARSGGLSADEVAHEAAQFRDHYLANGETRADWSACWRKWLGRRPAFAPRSQPPAGGQRPRVAGDLEIIGRIGAELEARERDRA